MAACFIKKYGSALFHEPTIAGVIASATLME
jgi:hypothetical protein